MPRFLCSSAIRDAQVFCSPILPNGSMDMVILMFPPPLGFVVLYEFENSIHESRKHRLLQGTCWRSLDLFMRLPANNKQAYRQKGTCSVFKLYCWVQFVITCVKTGRWHITRWQGNWGCGQIPATSLTLSIGLYGCNGSNGTYENHVSHILCYTIQRKCWTGTANHLPAIHMAT